MNVTINKNKKILTAGNVKTKNEQDASIRSELFEEKQVQENHLSVIEKKLADIETQYERLMAVRSSRPDQSSAARFVQNYIGIGAFLPGGKLPAALGAISLMPIASAGVIKKSAETLKVIDAASDILLNKTINNNLLKYGVVGRIQQENIK